MPQPTFVDVERECSDSNANHTLTMVEKLDGLRVEGEVPKMFIVEEVNGVLVQFEGECLKEGDVVGKNLLVREVQLEHDDGVDMIVGQQVV